MNKKKIYKIVEDCTLQFERNMTDEECSKKTKELHIVVDCHFFKTAVLTEKAEEQRAEFRTLFKKTIPGPGGTNYINFGGEVGD